MYNLGGITDKELMMTRVDLSKVVDSAVISSKYNSYMSQADKLLTRIATYNREIGGGVLINPLDREYIERVYRLMEACLNIYMDNYFNKIYRFELINRDVIEAWMAQECIPHLFGINILGAHAYVGKFLKGINNDFHKAKGLKLIRLLVENQKDIIAAELSRGLNVFNYERILVKELAFANFFCNHQLIDGQTMYIEEKTKGCGTNRWFVRDTGANNPAVGGAYLKLVSDGGHFRMVPQSMQLRPIRILNQKPYPTIFEKAYLPIDSRDKAGDFPVKSKIS